MEVRRALAFGGSLVLGLLGWAGPAHGGSAAALELLREAREHVAAHHDDMAVRRYTEALALDPTLPGAYLGRPHDGARAPDHRGAPDPAIGAADRGEPRRTLATIARRGG